MSDAEREAQTKLLAEFIKYLRVDKQLVFCRERETHVTAEIYLDDAVRIRKNAKERHGEDASAVDNEVFMKCGIRARDIDKPIMWKKTKVYAHLTADVAIAGFFDRKKEIT